jgi:hypothetical protein
VIVLQFRRDVVGIADEIDGGRTGIENIERRPCGDSGVEPPFEAQLLR